MILFIQICIISGKYAFIEANLQKKSVKSAFLEAHMTCPPASEREDLKTHNQSDKSAIVHSEINQNPRIHYYIMKSPVQ